MKRSSLYEDLFLAAKAVVDCHDEGKLNPTPKDSVRIDNLRNILSNISKVEKEEAERNAENAP